MGYKEKMKAREEKREQEREKRHEKKGGPGVGGIRETGKSKMKGERGDESRDGRKKDGRKSHDYYETG